MRNDFAVFILTHGRADNVVTVPAIKKAGYTGKIYFIIDDEDEQAEEYKKNFGADRVIIFDKQAAYDRADTMDNFNDHRAIIYARNECWRIAEELGLKYFLMLDDDYKSIDYRYEEDGKLKYKPCRIQNVPIRHHHPENHRQEEQVHCDYSGPKALMVVHLEVVEQNIRHTSKARFRMQGIWKTVQAKWRQDRMWKKSKKRHCRK